MSRKSAAIDNAIHAERFAIAATASKVQALIQVYKRTARKTLLDVTCGTGGYLARL